MPKNKIKKATRAVEGNALHVVISYGVDDAKSSARGKSGQDDDVGHKQLSPLRSHRCHPGSIERWGRVQAKDKSGLKK